MKKRLSTLLASVLIIPSLSFAANDAGLPGEFLNFGTGARPLGMGHAFTGVADSVDALYWNPAGLSTFRSTQVEFQHSPLPSDTAFDYAAYAQPVYAYGSFGVGLANVTSGKVDRVDENNVKIGSFDHRETGLLAGYAQRLGDRLSLGTNLKMAQISTDGRSASGFGADAGGLYRYNDRYSLGAMLQNLIPPSYGLSSEKETFPTIMRVGGAARLLNHHLLTAVDFEKTIGTPQGLKPHLGVEGNVVENVALRAGIDQTEITAGMGLRWRSIQFDYAAAFQDIGFENRFSITAYFGGYEVDVKASPRVFSPVGLVNKVTFKVRTTHRERIVKWIMTIRNAKDEVIQSFEGYNAPPEILEWDGKNAQGQIAEAGTYYYRMAITDAKDRVEKTPVRTIKILSPTPFEIEAK